MQLSVKATVRSRWDWSGLPCLVQHLTWLRVSECRNFWNNERKIYTLAFSYRNVFQNGVNSLSKLVIKIRVFCLFVFVFVFVFVLFCFVFVKKLKISCSLDHTILFKFHKHKVQTFFFRNIWRDFRLPMSALATVARKNFNGKFLQKLIFRSGILCYTCADAHGSLKSLHTLFDKYLYLMLVKFEKKIVRSEPYKI